MKPTLGRIVLYTLDARDAQTINDRRRTARGAAPAVAASGALMHKGNTVYAGQIFPMIITQVWKGEFGPGEDGVNGQVFLDGNDLHWVTSVGEVTQVEGKLVRGGPRTFSWPTKV